MMDDKGAILSGIMILVAMEKCDKKKLTTVRHT